jgi:hypothetical protein
MPLATAAAAAAAAEAVAKTWTIYCYVVLRRSKRLSSLVFSVRNSATAGTLDISNNSDSL